MSSASINPDSLKILLGYSLPVITCSHKLAGKVARGITDKGFYATKNLHYYGVKLHLLGLKRASTIPFPQNIEVTPASVHDLTTSSGILGTTNADVCIFDIKLKSDIGLFVIRQVKEKRLELKISQEDVASILDTAHGFIGQVESHKYPAKYNLNHLYKLAVEFACSMKDLFSEKTL